MIAPDMPAEVLDRLEMSVSGACDVRVTRACTSIITTAIVKASKPLPLYQHRHRCRCTCIRLALCAHLVWSAETTEPYAFRAAPNLAHKTMRPIQASKGIYRLQTNPALYEGVRYGFVIIHPCMPNATVRFTTPEPLWHIRAIRLVSPTPPVNYVGSVVTVGDDELSRIFLSGSCQTCYLHATNMDLVQSSTCYLQFWGPN